MDCQHTRTTQLRTLRQARRQRQQAPRKPTTSRRDTAYAATPTTQPDIVDVDEHPTSGTGHRTRDLPATEDAAPEGMTARGTTRHDHSRRNQEPATTRILIDLRKPMNQHRILELPGPTNHSTTVALAATRLAAITGLWRCSSSGSPLAAVWAPGGVLLGLLWVLGGGCLCLAAPLHVLPRRPSRGARERRLLTSA